MGQALYRKYRSKSLKEIVGQESITKTLQQALKQGKISHAYLLTGPRGVGKTSIARILAHEINELPYNDETTHIDIIEIDAASNRRIDEIRELREKVHIAPTSAKYKVYIIDEVHMLTREAFNALLKTLEEPPAHAVFILATTDLHKVPDTIISRTQRFNFKPVEKPKVVKHLAYIAEQEGIKVDPEALELLAEHGEGSFRDSISLLDQASSYGKVLDASSIYNLVGLPDTSSINKLYDLLSQRGSGQLINQLDRLYEQGFAAPAIAKSLGRLIRSKLVDGSSVIDSDEALGLMARLLQVPVGHEPARLLEIVLLEAIGPFETNSKPKPAKKAAAEPDVAADEPEQEQPESELVEALSEEEPAPQLPEQSAQAETAPKSEQALNAALWPEVIANLKTKNNTLYGIIRMAQPAFPDDKTLTLTFAFEFHQKRLKESSHQKALVDTIKALTGHGVKVECLLDKSISPPKMTVQAKKPAKSSDISAISNIFGGAELLES